MILGKDNIERLPPPVGTSDRARFSRTSYRVDKTLIVKNLIDSDATVVLFTHLRRFGKTTMMEMLRSTTATTSAAWRSTIFRAEGLADIVKIGLAYYKNKAEHCTD